MNEVASTTPDPVPPARHSAFGISFVAVIGALLVAGVTLPGLGPQAARRRDDQRIQDIEIARQAVEAYWRDHGCLPECAPDRGGDDTSLDHVFLLPLIDAGLLEQTLIDPRNGKAYYYCYRRFEASTVSGRGEQYVLGVRRLESDQPLRPSNRSARPTDLPTGDLAYCVFGPSESLRAVTLVPPDSGN